MATWKPGTYKDKDAFLTEYHALAKGAPNPQAAGQDRIGRTVYSNQAELDKWFGSEAYANTKAAAEYGQAQGWLPTNNGGGLAGGFVDAFLNPAVLAAVGGYALAPSAGAAAGESGAAAGSEWSALGPVGYDAAGMPIADTTITAGGTGAIGGAAGGTAVAANQTGTGAGIGSGSDAGNAAAATSAGGGSASSTGGAANLLKMVKDYGGLALTLGGLLGGGDDMPSEPALVEEAPDSQAARQPDEIQRRKNAAATGSTDNTLLTGASGIDPFSLNIGRSKLLGA